MALNAETTPERRAAAAALDVTPTGAALGAEVLPGDLRQIDDDAFLHKTPVLTS